jgi:hypothetical protein
LIFATKLDEGAGVILERKALDSELELLAVQQSVRHVTKAA